MLKQGLGKQQYITVLEKDRISIGAFAAAVTLKRNISV